MGSSCLEPRLPRTWPRAEPFLAGCSRSAEAWGRGAGARALQRGPPDVLKAPLVGRGTSLTDIARHAALEEG